MEKEQMNSVVFKIVETAPQIKRVDLVDGGRNGLKVSYHSLETRNGVINGKDSQSKWHRPVQQELRNYFAQMKEHLLKMCGYYWSNETVLELYKNRLEVSYVVYDKNLYKFQIGGKMKVGNAEGEYTISLNSANMLIDNYDNHADITRLLEAIIDEAKLFMTGVKGAEKKQVAIDYMITKKNMINAEADFDSMSLEDQELFIAEAFKSYGLTIVEEDGKMVLGAEEEKTEDVEFISVVEEVDEKKSTLSAKNETEIDDLPIFFDDML